MTKINNVDLFMLTGDEAERLKKTQENASYSVRSCIPAIIKSINYDTMTVEAQPAIREIMSENGNYVNVDLPLLVDVPLYFPNSSKFSITFPIAVEDECLIFFSDMCIDAWWQNGGIQNQFEVRRHDLSDGFCIPSNLSQAKKITNFNSDYLEIKNNETGVKIEIRDNTILVAGIDIVALAQRVTNLEPV